MHSRNWALPACAGSHTTAFRTSANVGCAWGALRGLKPHHLELTQASSIAQALLSRAPVYKHIFLLFLWSVQHQDVRHTHYGTCQQSPASAVTHIEQHSTSLFFISPMWYFTVGKKEKNPVSFSTVSTTDQLFQDRGHALLHHIGYFLPAPSIRFNLLLLLQQHGCAETTHTWYIHIISPFS